MFILKNSAKNIYRYKSKYITYGILFLLLITAASICVSVYLRMSVVTNTIIREYAGVSVLGENITNISNTPDRMTRNDYTILKNIEHINDVEMLKYNFRTDFLKSDVPPLNTVINSSVRIEAPVFVLGYNTSLFHLTSEEIILASGRMFTDEHECVISKNPKADDEDSAEWNKIREGDTIHISNEHGVSQEYTVVGISAENPNDTADTNRRIIYTSLEGAEYFDDIALVDNAGIQSYGLREISIEDIVGGYYDPNSDTLIKMGYEVLVYLDDPEEYLNVQDDFMKTELNGYLFTLEPMFSDFRSLLSMTRVMANNASGFMIIIAILLVFVTIITSIMLLGTRKYEIAVLRSIGMKKSRLIASYLIENLFFIWSITVISYITAQFISPFLTVHIFNGIQSMVSSDVYERIMGGFNFASGAANFCIVFGGSTVIVLLSSLLSCINIMRFEPLKIFNKRF